MFARCMLASSALLAILLGGSINAEAATFQPSRGISMDQWVTWPDASRWNDDDVVENFPEWRAFTQDAELMTLRAAGLDTVRLPIDPGFLLLSGDIIRTKKIFDGIDDAITRLNRAGLKVIVDMHTIPRDSGGVGIGQILNDTTTFEQYVDLAQFVAGKLEDYDPQLVALELINEPTLDCKDASAQAKWQDQLSALHRAARQANNAMTFVLTGACWGTAEGLSKLDPNLIGDDNTLWTFHHYEPFKLTHQSATWAGPWVDALSGIPYPPSSLSQSQAQELIRQNEARIFAKYSGKQATEIAEGTRYDIDKLRQPAVLEKEMTEPFEVAAQWADKHGIARNRIFMGEFGMLRQEWEREPATLPQWRIAYIKDMINLAEGQGFAWSLWSFGGAFGMMQEFGGKSLADPLVDDVLR